MELDFEKPLLEIEKRIAELTRLNADPNVQFGSEIAELSRKLASMKRKTYGNLTPWQTVQVARHEERPLFGDFVQGVFSEFIELHGDRAFGDDKALRGGFATIDKHRVMLLGMDKGKTVEMKVERNFGMANPEGYRKALRLMQLAAATGRPIVTFIDTPGAYPGIGAEERGQGEAIARNLREMAGLPVPIIVFVMGEGGSGGALAIGVGDRVYMLENSIYSVISPEGCAAILWRDRAKAQEAAKAMKITAQDALRLGAIDAVLDEPTGGSHRDYAASAATVRARIEADLDLLEAMAPRDLLDARLAKFLAMGIFHEKKSDE